MINNMKLMKNKKVLFTIVGILVIVILAILLTSGNSKNSEYEVETLNSNQYNQIHIDNLNTAISKVLINEQTLNDNGKVLTEGHVILDKEERDNYIKVYLIASGGSFGFEGNTFTITSGYSLIPMVMDFSKDENGNLIFIKKQEPMDGSYYIKSLKNMFPYDLHKTVIHETERYREDIEKQQKIQANNYLNSINSNAKIKIN